MSKNDQVGSNVGKAHPEREVSLAAYAAVLILVIAISVIIDALFFANGASLKREGGGLEMISAVLYINGVIVFFKVVPSVRWLSLWQIPALLVFFALRELDFDKAFTSSGVLSSNLYRGDSALTTKLIAGSVLVLFLVVVFRIIRKGAPAVFRSVRNRETWGVLAIGAVAVTVATKQLDGLGRKLGEIGIEVSQGVDFAASMLEEVGEAFIPVLIILALLACWKGRSNVGSQG
ncbi:MAG: hypothetical protein AAF665_06395 [Pseudomonadota bacterium]